VMSGVRRGLSGVAGARHRRSFGGNGGASKALSLQRTACVDWEKALQAMKIVRLIRLRSRTSARRMATCCPGCGGGGGHQASHRRKILRRFRRIQ